MQKSVKFHTLAAFALYSTSMLPATASLHASGVYVGTSFGVSQLSGKRTDSISSPFITLTLYNDKRMSDTSLEASLFAGYRYVPCQTNFVFSLEGSFGYGPYENIVYKNLTPGLVINDVPINGNQVAILKRGIGYGITARAGYIAHQKLMPYLLIGKRMDRFTYLSIGPDASNAGQKKLLLGTDFGGGIETCLVGLKTALEFKYTYYHRENRFNVEETTGNLAVLSTRPHSASLSLRFTHIF